MEAEEPKVTIGEKFHMEEGPLEQRNSEAGRYMAHHSTDKTPTAELITETRAFVEKLRYPWGQQFLEGADDYLYCCPKNLEIDICRYMMDYIGFTKLEVGLFVMSSEGFLGCLAYTHLKVYIHSFCAASS
jgi:hypothetical protein